jgi:hypothetical protein
LANTGDFIENWAGDRDLTATVEEGSAEITGEAVVIDETVFTGHIEGGKQTTAALALEQIRD